MRSSIVLFTFLFILSSCSDHSKNDLAVFKATEEGLLRSSENISSQNLFLYRLLEQKLYDPGSKEVAEIWQPKAAAIQQLSSGLSKYIEGLRNDLKNEASIKNEKGDLLTREDDMDAVSRLFQKKGKGDELYERLKKYKQDMLAVDAEMGRQFENKFPMWFADSAFDTGKQKDFAKTFFDHVPVIAALAMLGRFENDVKITESEFVAYCNNKTHVIIESFTRFSAIVTMSSEYVKAGDEVEINAGVGAFSVAANPKITINGQGIQLDPNGVATYKLKTSLKPGKYIVPVKINYLNPDGTAASLTKNVSYTVATEK